MMKLKPRITELMAERGFNPASLSREIGKGRTYVTELLSASQRDPGIQKVQLIARALGTSVAYLIGETDDPTPSAPLRKFQHGIPLTALRVNAGVSFFDDQQPEVALSVDTVEEGEVGFLLTEEATLVARERFDDALRDLSDNRRKSASNSSMVSSSG